MKTTPVRGSAPTAIQKPPTETMVLVASKLPTVDTAFSVTPRRDDEDDGKASETSEAVEMTMTSVSLAAAAAADSANDKLISEMRSEAVRVNPAASAAAAEEARRNRIANIKTAAMLFVVTIVFAISFFPSLAMTVHILPYNMTIFYMYFANNVANPIIYSFMNTNFRKRLARLFRKSS